MDKYVQIGQMKKTHGAQGEIKADISEDFLEDFANSDVVFINVQGKPVPFFIESLRDVGDILIKLEDVDSPNDAKPLVAQAIFLRETDLVHFQKNKTTIDVHSFRHFVGYTVVDSEIGAVGVIQSVETYPQQELAVVVYLEREVLIPLNRQIIFEIDEKSKTLRVNLPEGLLDL